MAEALQPVMQPADAIPRASMTLALFPPVTLFLFLGPVIAGLIGLLLPAFGYFPALGSGAFSLSPWLDLMAAPGLGTALWLTVFTGFAAAVITFTLAVALVAAWHGTKTFARLRRWLAPLLAVPHAAFAIGFAFLAAPSGWIARLISPWLTGWDVPPDVASVQDPYGIALVVALVCKEVFFLLLMILAALGQIPADKLLASARTMGYGPVCAWIKAVLPLVYRQIRLPVYAVLAYSLSVVDMALVLGPTNPPTLAVLILRWFQSPDFDSRFQAAAGATLLLLCIAGSIGVWWMIERIVAGMAAPWIAGGGRRLADRFIKGLSASVMTVVLAATVGAVLVLMFWSATDIWRFPAALPQEFSLAAWSAAWPRLADALWTTLVVAVIATLIALVVVVGCLENERRHGISPTQRSLTLLYMPLLVPQISFLFGLQIVFVFLNLDGTYAAVIWCHLVFVLPYMFLVLSDPYRALDPRYARTAATLGASPRRIFWRVQLPLLVRAVLTATAVGFAVSVSQYLATLFPGVGRLPTVTTEAMVLASGGDRRLTAVYGFVQMLLPLAVFALAIAIPAGLSRNRRGLSAK
jgi:putative thiamine transport system permease protein